MTKSLAAAVIWAITSLIGSTDLNDWPVESDDIDEGIVDLAETPGASARPGAATVLRLASIACGERIDHAWVIGNAACPDGAIAIQIGGQVAHLNLAIHAYPAPATAILTSLLPRALEACRDLGMLKVTVEATNVDSAALASVVQSCGYQFSRLRQVGGASVSEFYTDLYSKGRCG